MTSENHNNETDKNEKENDKDTLDFVEKTHYENQKRFCAEKEWPGIKYKHDGYKSPFVIKELFRFVPYKDDGHYIKFHAFNMPDVKIKAVEFVGTVMVIHQKEENNKFIIITVSDGTGCITVVYNFEKYEKAVKNRLQIDEKHERFMKIALRKKPWLQSISNDDKMEFVPPFGPPFEYPEEIPRSYRLELIRNWWLETKGGMLGKKFAIGDYVHVDGFCSLDFDRMRKPKGQIGVEHLTGAKLICNATSVRLIAENEYNEKLQSWIQIYVRRRYKS